MGFDVFSKTKIPSIPPFKFWFSIYSLKYFVKSTLPLYNLLGIFNSPGNVCAIFCFVLWVLKAEEFSEFPISFLEWFSNYFYCMKKSSNSEVLTEWATHVCILLYKTRTLKKKLSSGKLFNNYENLIIRARSLKLRKRIRMCLGSKKILEIQPGCEFFCSL